MMEDLKYRNKLWAIDLTTIVSTKSSHCLLYIEDTFDRNSGRETSRVEVINLENSILLFSAKVTQERRINRGAVFLPTKQEELRNKIRDSTRLNYLKSSNLVIGLTNNRDGLFIYRLGHSAMKKVTHILFSTVPYLRGFTNRPDLICEPLHPQNIVALFTHTELILLNILTRKRIRHYQLESPLGHFKPRFMPATKYLVVPSKNKLVIYEVSGQLVSLKLMPSLNLRVCDDDGESCELLKIHCSEDMVLIVYVRKEDDE